MLISSNLQKFVGPEYDEVNRILGTLRKGAKKTLPTDIDRKRFFDSIIAAGILDMLRDGRRREAYETIARACEGAGVPLSDEVHQALGSANPAPSA